MDIFTFKRTSAVRRRNLIFICTALLIVYFTSTNRIFLRKFEGFPRKKLCDTTEESELTKVVLLTSFRGGSSFVGSMFFLHPDIFYTFEPLKLCVLPHIKYELVQDYIHIQCVRHILDCNIRGYLQDLRYMKPGNVTENNREIWFERIFGKVIAEKSVWPDDYSINDVCRLQHKHRVVKLIRMDTIESLVSLMEEGVKVLYVIRDPRGVVSSRYQYYNGLPKEKIEENALKECLKHDKNVEFLRNSFNDQHLFNLLGENLRIILYDDMRTNPAKYTEAVYKFLNIPLPSEIRDFVTYNRKTNVWYIPKDRIIEEIQELVNNETAKQNEGAKFYSRLPGWRNNLYFEYIDIIQRACEQTMQTYRMRTINEEEYNNTSLVNEIGAELPKEFTPFQLDL